LRSAGYHRRVLRPVLACWLVATAARAQPPELSAVIASAPRCDPARKTCIGLRFHVPVTDTGPIATAGWVDRQLANANHHFAKLDVAFQIVGVAPLPAEAEYIADRDERAALGALIEGRVIDVFITGSLADIDHPGNMIYGVTWWTTGDRKFVIVSTAGYERTLAHELGHVFGLPHSKYAISIMNKTQRKTPAFEDRTFHKKEFAIMKERVRQLLKDKTLENLKARK
jgi:hypothetical protein